MIASSLAALRDTIAETCRRVGREPGSVRLVAVSKTRPVGDVLVAARAGQLLFGENRVQEARDKIPGVDHPGLSWHLIGPLQRNKVKIAVQLFQMIQSVDSIELARELDRRMPVGRTMPILLQVNVGGEAQKSGLAPGDLEKTLIQIASLPRLSVKGLMTVPPFAEDPERVRPEFRKLACLARDMAAHAIPGVSMEILSMGMSHDFIVAIEEGATMVRIGGSLFGTRNG
ncbi:MAG: YggS family pyridoxal phosphate-dependent enzyme [Magnetococcales bacterium]|nr:YggS family pyridoxal phosphate-dependent enzyme [Magnetococcales bacterium]